MWPQDLRGFILAMHQHDIVWLPSGKTASQGGQAIDLLDARVTFFTIIATILGIRPWFESLLECSRL